MYISVDLKQIWPLTWNLKQYEKASFQLKGSYLCSTYERLVTNKISTKKSINRSAIQFNI